MGINGAYSKFRSVRYHHTLLVLRRWSELIQIRLFRAYLFDNAFALRLQFALHFLVLLEF